MATQMTPWKEQKMSTNIIFKNASILIENLRMNKKKIQEQQLKTKIVVTRP